MHRFFVPLEGFSEDLVTIVGPDVNHIGRVLRLKKGDCFYALDGNGNQFKVEVMEVKHDKVKGKIVAQQKLETESPVFIWMGQSLIKGNRFDNLVRKAVELGVGSVVPLHTIRSIPKFKKAEESKKLERWQRISQEASKQSERTKIPEVYPSILDLKQYFDLVQESDLKFIFWEQEAITSLRDFSKESDIKSIAFLVGPEGGWSREEVEQAKCYGFKTVSLGPRKLRADSASLVVLSLLQHIWGDI